MNGIKAVKYLERNSNMYNKKLIRPFFSDILVNSSRNQKIKDILQLGKD